MAAGLPQSGVALTAQGASAFLGAMRGAKGAVDDFDGATSKAAGGISSAFSKIGSVASAAAKVVAGALVAAGVAAGGFLASSVNVAADFEQTMNVLGATSGATASELAAVAEKAKDLGADLTLPTTSATDAANVMLELSKAGMSVQEAMDAAKGSLQLAAAAQVDAATAANIMSGALNAFQLPATEAVRVADLLAAGANASSASMTDLSQGLQQAGFAFNAAGLPVEDLVTSLAALTNVGLTGSDAGTALKNALMRLMNPTEKAAGLMADLGFSAYDSAGKMKQLPQIIADLNTAFAGMTDEERNAALGTIFLSDGMKAMIPLLDIGQDGFIKLKGAVTEQGAAAAVAGAQTVGFKGAIAGAQSQIETLQLVIGQQLLPLLTPLIQRFSEAVAGVTGFVEAFMPMVPTIAASAEPFRALLQAITIINPGFLTFATLALKVYDALAPVVGIFAETGVNAYSLSAALVTLAAPMGATTSALVDGQMALYHIGAAFTSVAATLSGTFAGSVGSTNDVLASLVNTVLSTVLPALATAATWFAANLPTAIATAQAAFQNISAFIATVMPTIQGIITGVIDLISAIWAQWGDELQTIASGAWLAVQGLIQTVLGVIQGVVAVFTAAISGDWQSQMGAIESANAAIWNGIKTFLTGILEIIAGGFGTSLGEIKATWEGNFRAFASIAETLMGRAREAITPALAAISGAFSAITGAIGDAITAVKNFISAAAQIVVPDLVTPGSPTPLELGFRGITSSMRQAASVAEGAFAPALASVAPAAMTSPAAMPGPANISRSTTVDNSRTYQMPIYTNQSPAVLQQSLAIAEALAL